MPPAPAMSHRVDADGILRVAFDGPDDRVNLLNAEILESLGRLLDEARQRDDVRALLFGSGKPGMFLAGMDIEQIASVTDAARAAEGARLGQGVFRKIADLGKPSACAIRGTCLGGGTELALACSFRLAARDERLRIGLPEVRLGIIPGFGGTQRLPRLVGLTAALDLILSGRSIDARRARRIGLVDRVVPEPYLEREAVALLKRAIAEGTEATATALRGRPPLGRSLGRIGALRKLVLDRARKRAARKASPADYPAPFRALEAVEAALTRSMSHGLDFEARLVGELVPTPTTRNLLWLFRGQTALKKDGLRAAPRKVKRVAVLGAGIMGGGIAQLAADREIPVRLKDVRYDAVLAALRTAQGVWDSRLKRKRITPREAAQKMAYIAPTLDYTGLAKVDLVLEAVVERLEIKHQVLAEVESCVDERAVFASNTSSLPIGEIAARARYPERVVGMHFFNPVHRMPLVEIIAGKRSSPEAVATVHALAIRLGKTPVIVRDGPGFLVNRILSFYLNEAMQLLAEGVRIEAVDRAMVGFGMPLGPFALLDQVGLDTAMHVGEVVRAAFGHRVGRSESMLGGLVAAGRLGCKNQRGFYRYRRGKSIAPDGEVYGFVGDPSPKELPAETLQERMVLTMVNEAAVCLQEGLVRGPRDVDLAMVLGTGFPPFRGGLLRHADAVGVPIITDRLSRLAEAHGERFRPAGLWGEMVRDQRRFYGDG